MTDDRSATPEPDRGAIPAGAEPSLAARIARSGEVGGIADGRPNPVADDDETGLDQAVREGDQRAPRGDRVDAAAATFGADATRDELADAAGGRARGSVGGGMLDDPDRPSPPPRE